MVRAGSLLYAICVVLILSILSSSLILLAFNLRTAIDLDLIQEKQIRNVYSGLNLFLADPSVANSPESSSVDLFGEPSDSVYLSSKPWGLFLILKVLAHQKSKSAEGAFMIGDQSKGDRTAIYLADQNKPLAVCGNTIIKGKCFLPAMGLKRAYIEGKNFIGTKMVQGEVRTSQTRLPEWGAASLNSISDTQNEDSLINIQELQENKLVSNSFLGKTLVIHSPSSIELDNYQMKGNIKLLCDGKILIRKSCVLKDVIVSAKSIEIEKEFSGSLQLIARDSIVLKEEVQLTYPSVMAISQSATGKIVLGRNCQVQGTILNVPVNQVSSKQLLLDMQSGCYITGTVYVDGYVQLNGKITGSLYCNGFILKTSSAIYENHLLDAEVNSEELPEYFVGNFPVSEVRRKALIKNLR